MNGRPIRDHFDSRDYRERVREGLGRTKFSIDWDEFERKAQED
jgi:hypothetical protein